MVNCIGHPPSAETSHRLLRPLIFETKTTDFPSGDQSARPTCRVMKSFSIERFFSTVPFGLLKICLGSVTARGTGKVWDALRGAHRDSHGKCDQRAHESPWEKLKSEDELASGGQPGTRQVKE